MNKKIIIPVVLFVVIVVFAISTCMGGGKVELSWDKVEINQHLQKDSIELKVYVENSGSMDAYMCPGSNLKDAVYDYVSDLKKYSSSCSLNYINSQIIPFKGELDSYIKNLIPASFAMAGGNRSNTDLRAIIAQILQAQKKNTVSIFVSDCILDIPQSSLNFFGNCQVSVKNSFNEALAKKGNENLGVEIIQLESKFDGYWYCGQNSEKLSNVKRPYYIWIIGNQNILSYLNSKVNVNDIIGGIKNYCAYAPSQKIPFDIDKKIYVANHTKKIHPQLLVNLTGSLQSELLISNVSNYKSSNPAQTTVVSVQKINGESPYSHVVELEIANPETLRSETLSFTYPLLPDWVTSANDDTGVNVKQNMNKTTGILYLIKGVAEAYKTNTEYGSISFSLKNK